MVDYRERIKTERKNENVPNEPALHKKVIKILREKGGGGGGMILKVKNPPHKFTCCKRVPTGPNGL
jgi:hypothetical protein